MSAQLLEEGPSDEAKQEALREELKGHPAIADDETVLEKASAVRDALSREPSEALVVLGVDISKPMPEVARRRSLPAHDLHIAFELCDAQSGALGRERFDAAFSRCIARTAPLRA